MLKDFLSKLPFIKNFVLSVHEIREEMDTLKSKMEVPDALFHDFQRDRKSAAYLEVFEKEDPLVSVCIATYNRGQLLIARSLNSILSQTYRNIEVIVIGDCCSDQTVELMAQVSDPRVRFVNLSKRGEYPEERSWRWMVAGTAAVNTALQLARGDFITHLDDDDTHDAERIAKLVNYARVTKADIIWHPFFRELAKGRWQLKRSQAFRRNEVTTSSVFYHHWLKQIPWDIHAYMLREPGDWNRFRKFKYLGVRAERFPEPLLRHYKERNQSN